MKDVVSEAGHCGWKAEVRVFGDAGWHSNGLVFCTSREARDYVLDLMMRWTQVDDTRFVKTNAEPTHTFVDGKLEEIA